MCKRWVLCGVMLAVLVGMSGLSWAATDINLKQSGGGSTLLGGVGEAAKVTVVSGSGISVGGCTATAAAPTEIEGDTVTSSCDLRGSTRVTLGDLISGEDQLNNLLMTSGGKVRLTQILGTGGIPSTATDATSATSVLPIGMKTFQGVVTCTGTCVQTQKIYGTYANAATVAASALVCTLTISGTTTASDWCATDRNFMFWFVVTTLTSGTTPLSGIFVQY